MADPIAVEHAVLFDVGTRLIRELEGARAGVQGGEILHAQHLTYAERTQELGALLDSAVVLAQMQRYAHAFTVLRAALEHHVFDQLLMLARTYTVAFTGVSQQEWDQWQLDRASGESWTKDIVNWEYRKGNPLITFAGRFNVAKPRETLSAYYFLMREYHPFQGKPEEQPFLIPHFNSNAEQRKRAMQTQRLYSEHFGWRALIEGLALNGLINARNRMRLGVHYRFMSAFAHPTTDQSRLLYGNNVTGYRYDHYSSELVLLYVAVLGARGLRTLRRALERPPRTTLINDQEVADLVQVAEHAAAHLWFPGQAPHAFDRVQEANNRKMTRRGGFVPLSARTPPGEVRPGTVRYYRNPLVRLVQMHSSQHELTGWAYLSPWHRDDARYR